MRFWRRHMKFQNIKRPSNFWAFHLTCSPKALATLFFTFTKAHGFFRNKSSFRKNSRGVWNPSWVRKRRWIFFFQERCAIWRCKQKTKLQLTKYRATFYCRSKMKNPVTYPCTQLIPGYTQERYALCVFPSFPPEKFRFVPLQRKSPFHLLSLRLEGKKGPCFVTPLQLSTS